MLEVGSASICGSDLGMLSFGLPVTIGHEIAGTVDGQGYCVEPTVGCGQCDQCRGGSPQRCRGSAPHGLLGVAVLVGVVAAYAGLVLGRHGALLGPVLRAVAIAYPLYLLAVVRPITSMWRFLLLDLPVSGLLAALVLRAGHPSRRVRLARAAVLAVLLVAGVVLWTATVWTYEPFGSSPP